MAHRLFRPLAVLAFTCSAFGLVNAAELGEPRVSSYIGQQLVADVELTALEDAAAPVQARLASADVYRGASIAMPPALNGLHLSVMRRDGRQFLHLTTLRPVDTDHLHVYLELADGTQRTVRLATLWLAPDPNPAPPVPVASPAAAPAAPVAPVPARASAAAAPAVPAPPRTRARPAVPAPQAPHRAPRKPVGWAAPLPTRSPKPAPPPVPAVAMRSAPGHAPTPASAPAECPQQPAPTQPSACLALDGKNAALRAEVGQLEDKVKALQAALTGAPVALAKAKQVSSPARRAPQPHPPAIGKSRPKLPPRDEGWPIWVWLAAGGGVAALGAGLFAWRRFRSPKPKKKKKINKPEMEVVVTPRVMGDVKSRLMTEQTE